MLQKESWVYITDNTNVCWIKIFHLYKGFFRKTTKPGSFVKGSAQIVNPPRLEYKGFKYKFKIKGDIVRSCFIRGNNTILYSDKKNLRFNNNASILINKKFNILSKYLNGPLSKSVRIKKLVSLFKIII